MPTISKTLKVNIEPHEAAEIFCDMDAEQQAQFFNHVGRLTERWTNHLAQQLESIRSSGVLTEKGVYIMCKIGEYAEIGENSRLQEHKPEELETAITALKNLLEKNLSEVPKASRHLYAEVWKKANEVIEKAEGEKTGFVIE